MFRRHSVALIVTVAVSAYAAPSHADYGDITLCGQLLPDNAIEITDVWGYVDQATGLEYAIIGSWTAGIYIIDVTDPTAPFLRKFISGFGFDVKVYQHYVYTCSGFASGTTSRVTDIADIDNPIGAAPFAGAHNFSISDDGYLYAELLGLKCYDIHTNPMVPALKWSDSNADAHDSYPVGDRLYDFRGAFATYIWDISNRLSPQLITTIDDPIVSYHHSGSPDKNGNYLYICNESALHPMPDVTIWDITDPDSAMHVGSIADSTATMHNLYIVGDLAFASHYSAGFRVYDVTVPPSPVLLDSYDTAPSWTGENWEGCFGVYPFSETGKIYVSDWDNGLFIFSVEGHTASAVSSTVAPAGVTLAQNHPNPFNPTTTISYALARRGRVSLAIYDARGRHVRTLVDDVVSAAGAHDALWDGSDNNGVTVASGVYFYRLRVDGRSLTKRMVLLK